MKYFNQFVEWLQSYQMWDKKDYIMAVVGIIIVLSLIVSFFLWQQEAEDQEQVDLEVSPQEQNTQD